MINSIPLSWRRIDINRPRFLSVELPLSGLSWIHAADIPLDRSFEEVHSELLSRFPKGFLIRGCSAEIARYMARRGCSVMRTGADGIIDLRRPRESRASVDELVRRGMRRGRVEEIPFTESNACRVTQLTSSTAYGEKPNLKYLFRTRFDPETRCFAFRAVGGKWLGVVTISQARESRAHTELLLRDKNAPPGVMEALVTGVMKTLREEGYEMLSLGEVPFVTDGGEESGHMPSPLSMREKVLFRAGHMLKFAFNYKGLYRFKNKFDPEWRPVYVCATPGLPFLALADLFRVSRYMELSGSEFIKAVRNIGPAFVKSA